MTKTLYDQAMEMYQRQAYKTLILFKKTKKKSWAALGVNAEMEARIMEGADALYGDDRVSPLPSVKEETAAFMPTPIGKRRFDNEVRNLVVYKHRKLHGIMGETSHMTMALVSAIREQEKFRADPRFPLFQIAQRIKRYKEIFTGQPYLPIFS